ncbi:MAG TPA: hypothetical protein VFI25_07935 [Planctomycetota bacterium]|jgi:tetratricopeptide (TPR) repeat protein|nr:hypothetical protein [Planctomycetota bacterium]
MNAKPLLLSSVLGAVVAVLVSLALQRSARTEAELREELARVEAEMARLRARSEEVAKELESARGAASSGAPVPRISHEEIAEAVARWMERNGPPAAAVGSEAVVPRPPDLSARPEGSLTVESASRMLLDPRLGHDEKEKLWKRLREQGLLDEMVAWFEARAKEDPNDPQRQVELGQAYVQKIFEAGNSPEAGKWATMADKAWDRALELDSRNWDARFSKAIGLSFWPPIFGKQPEAIRQFETLVEQQEAGPLQPSYAQTYLLLGNLYLQSGAGDKATAVWQKGLALFPANAELRARLSPR